MFGEFLNQIVSIFNMIMSDEPNNWAILISVVSQLVLIFVILYAVFKKFIKGTSSEALVKGIFVLILGWL